MQHGLHWGSSTGHHAAEHLRVYWVVLHGPTKRRLPGFAAHQPCCLWRLQPARAPVGWVVGCCSVHVAHIVSAADGHLLMMLVSTGCFAQGVGTYCHLLKMQQASQACGQLGQPAGARKRLLAAVMVAVAHPVCHTHASTRAAATSVNTVRAAAAPRKCTPTLPLPQRAFAENCHLSVCLAATGEGWSQDVVVGRMLNPTPQSLVWCMQSGGCACPVQQPARVHAQALAWASVGSECAGCTA